MLDVGCGNGEKTAVHRDLASGVIGLDIELKKLKEAKRRGIPVILGTALKLPFKDNTFDLVTSFHVIEHLEFHDALIFLDEVSRVLKNGGYFIMITPNRRRLTSFVNHLLRPFKKLKYPMNPDHKHEFVKEELEELFQKSNFSEFKIIPIGLVRLIFVEIANIPRFLSKYSDQIMVVARK